MIRVRHKDDGNQEYVCINCCGVEDVYIANNRDLLWKHLEDFHGWPDHNKESLDVWERIQY